MTNQELIAGLRESAQGIIASLKSEVPMEDDIELITKTVELMYTAAERLESESRSQYTGPTLYTKKTNEDLDVPEWAKHRGPTCKLK